ncbi:MAG TPA: X2-like carbohydrate binding domain-containing protein, partial [Clostridia bacterium]|nr:X2-like carbohydrate binding domain-containing protein [Clostridia bacterium]
GLPAVTAVNDITVLVSSTDISYGTPAQTHDDGTLHLFLSEGNKDITLRAGNVDYTVDIAHIARKNPNTASAKTSTWDKYGMKDLEIDLYLNGAELSGITFNTDIALTASDYTFSGNILKIKYDFLSGLASGNYSIKIAASSGISPVVMVNLIDTTDEHYSLRTLTVPDTIITVRGYIHNDAVLTVTPLEEGSAIFDVLKTAADANHGIIYAHEIKLELAGDAAPFLGGLEVTFSLGDLYDGQSLRIIYLSKSGLKTYPVVGENGLLKVTVSELSPMGVIVPLEDFEPFAPLPQAGQSTIPLIILAALSCIAVLLSIVLYKRKKDI